MKFNESIIITDPCYIIRDRRFMPQMYEDDWNSCSWGEDMEALGIKNYMVSSSGVGDWRFSLRKGKLDSEGDLIGNFCTDSGLIGVFNHSQVLEYNPFFERWLGNRVGLAVILKDFQGNVKFTKNKDTGFVHIVGTGSLDFYSCQR